MMVERSAMLAPDAPVVYLFLHIAFGCSAGERKAARPGCHSIEISAAGRSNDGGGSFFYDCADAAAALPSIGAARAFLFKRSGNLLLEASVSASRAATQRSTCATTSSVIQPTIFSPMDTRFGNLPSASKRAICRLE
jgi:hypothetical protein